MTDVIPHYFFNMRPKAPGFTSVFAWTQPWNRPGESWAAGSVTAPQDHGKQRHVNLIDGVIGIIITGATIAAG